MSRTAAAASTAIAMAPRPNSDRRLRAATLPSASVTASTRSTKPGGGTAGLHTSR
jgi:hypothetical protein